MDSDVLARGGSKAIGEKKERLFHKRIKERRAALKDGNKGTIKHTHSVPTELYHGKIKQTGDKNYWRDPKNLAKHKSCKVD